MIIINLNYKFVFYYYNLMSKLINRLDLTCPVYSPRTTYNNILKND